MRVSDFEQPDEELKRLADASYAEMENLTPEQGVPHLLAAQAYMAAVDRRHDDKIAKRDFRMEIVVIALIAFEVIGGIYEGGKQVARLEDMKSAIGKQTDILNPMNTSAGDTSKGMTAAAQSLKTLSDDQKKANDNVQANLQQTRAMAKALEQQLKILKLDQAAREEQLSRKPKLELYDDFVPLNTAINVQLPKREETDTSWAFDLNLRNSGDAAATKGTLRIMFQGKDVRLQCSSPSQLIVEPPDSLTHTYIIPFDTVRRNGNIPMIITFTYPKGQTPFQVVFNVDAEEIETGTLLGVITVRPAKPFD